MDLKRINPQMTIMESPDSKIDEIRYEDFEVESSNAREGSLHLKDDIQCDVCKNKGFVFIRKEDIVRATPCACVIKRKVHKNIKESGLGELLKYRLNDFKADHEWQKHIKQLAVDYVTNNRENNWFALLGQSGTGKTMICSAIARKLIEDGMDTRYCVWNILVKELKRNVMDDGYNKMFDQYAKAKVLYIDDFLKGSYTDKDITYAFELINQRYNNTLITIVSSELFLADLMDIDSAIAGRIKQKTGKYLIEIDKDEKKNFRLK